MLKIHGRRSDGYHELESLMVPISLCDRLEVSIQRAAKSRIGLQVTGPERVTEGADNLVARAAQLFLEERGLAAHVDIRLEKRIPFGAGLGGGSSDAAAILRCLDRAFATKLGPSGLRPMAASLGADVPFFLSCRPSWATGIGDVLESVPGFPDLHLVVVVPARRVDTSWAYRNALAHLTSRETGRSFARLSLQKAASGEGFFNDFEPGVSQAVPDIGRLSERLLAAGAVSAVLSGSGSAVVGIFEARPQADAAAGEFLPSDQAWSVRLLRRAPTLR